MSWLPVAIFTYLLLCFLAGLVVGLVWLWLRRRADQSDVDQARLASEAESDRLRLRISSLEMSEERATNLKTELDRSRLEAKRVPVLEEELEKAGGRAAQVPRLEAKVTELRKRVTAADRLTSKVEELQNRAAEADRLELDVVGLRAAADQTKALQSQLDALGGAADRASTLDGELRTVRLALEETRGRVAQLDVDLSATNAELDVARADAARATELEVTVQRLKEKAAVIDRLENELERTQGETHQLAGLQNRLRLLELELADAKTEAARGGELRSELDACKQRSAQLTAELEAFRTAAPEPQPLAEPSPAPEPVPAPELAPAGGGSWVSGTTTVGTPGADHVDDLKVIRGIGPVLEGTLNGLGIQSWEQIAAFTTEDIERVSEAISTFPGRIERDDWVGGAQRLLDAGHDPHGAGAQRP